MNTAQRIVKYLALALAVIILIGIVGGGLKLAGLLVHMDRNEAPLKTPVTQTIGENVTALEMDLKGVELEVRKGAAFTVETDSSTISVRLRGNTLVVRENNSWLQKNTGNVWITLPEGFTFHETEINTGAGDLHIEGLSTEELEMSLGAGKLYFSDLNVLRKAEIDGGAGQIILQNGTIQNLDMDLGVGELNLTARLTGKSQIDCGVGKVDLMLIDAEAYSIRLDKGVGEATYRGEPMKNGTVYGTGEAWVEIDGGIGSITIDLAESGIED